jgi:hypothetical protein
MSNVAKWLHFFGVQDVPAWVAAKSMDGPFIAVSVIISGIYIWIVFVRPAQRRKKSQERFVVEQLSNPAVQIWKTILQGDAGDSRHLAEKVYSPRTTPELLGYYRSGLTALQASEHIRPHANLWKRVNGSVYQIGDGGSDAWVMLREAGEFIECRFDKSWTTALMRHQAGDRLNVEGRISHIQNGDRLRLYDCELISTAPPASPQQSPAP